MSDNPALAPKSCRKCGASGEVIKAGSRRFWVQCARFGKNGNCNAIGSQADNRKEAIQNWNNIN